MGGYNILKAGVKMDVEALFPQTCYTRSRRVSPIQVGDQLTATEEKSLLRGDEAVHLPATAEAARFSWFKEGLEKFVENRSKKG